MAELDMEEDIVSLKTTEKEKIRNMYNRQEPGTENLYAQLGYFMRMQLWDWINDPCIKDRIMSAETWHECACIYDYVLELMNCYIKNPDSLMENSNVMISNRDQIKLTFNGDPEKFVVELRHCLRREQELLKCYNDTPSHSSQDSQPMQINPSSNGAGPEEPLKNSQCVGNDHNACQMPKLDIRFLEEIEAETEKFEKQVERTQGIVGNTTRHISHPQPSSALAMVPVSNDSQILESLFNNLLNLLESALTRLKEIRKEFLSHQEQAEVGLLHNGGDIEHIAPVFDKYAAVLKRLFNHFEVCCPRLKKVIDHYMTMALIVSKNPAGLIFIKGRDSAAEKDLKTKKPKILIGKGINATLKILGGKALLCMLDSYSVKLIGVVGETAGELSVPNHCELTDNSMIAFQDIELKSHIRSKNSMGMTRNGFVTLSFTLKVSCLLGQHELKTDSMCFNLYSGSNQIMECVGTRLWHTYSRMHGLTPSDSQRANDLSASDVLCMLGQRIISLSCDCEARRGLSFGAQKFLLERIPSNGECANKFKDMITEKNFSQNKTLGKGDAKFTPNTWFQACLNTIKEHLLQPWLDGVVFDLMTNDEAEQILQGDTVPPYTGLIRPVTSLINKPCSLGANLDIALSWGSGSGDKIKVMKIPISRVEEYGLANALKAVITEDTNETVIKNILTFKHELMSLDELEARYSKGKAPESVTTSYHKNQVKTIYKQAVINSDKTPPSVSPAKNRRVSQKQNSFVKRRSCKPRAPNHPVSGASSVASLLCDLENVGESPSPVQSCTTNVSSPSDWSNNDSNASTASPVANVYGLVQTDVVNGVANGTHDVSTNDHDDDLELEQLLNFVVVNDCW